MSMERIPGHLNRKIGQAMHEWCMLDDGDRVLVAVSGGVDSLVMTWVLHAWRHKAPIRYELQPVYVIDNAAAETGHRESSAELIGKQVRSWGLPFTAVTGWGADDDGPRDCFTCSRNRRSLLFDFARRRGCSKLAFGHHKDDLIDTFFINLLRSGNISTMLPRQDLFDGRLSLIRILAYLEKKEVELIAERTGIEPVADRCPLAGSTQRDLIQDLVREIDVRVPGAKSSIFAALGNVRHDYLLSQRGANARRWSVDRAVAAGSIDSEYLNNHHCKTP